MQEKEVQPGIRVAKEGSLLGVCTQPMVLDGRGEQHRRERLRVRPSESQNLQQVGT